MLRDRTKLVAGARRPRDKSSGEVLLDCQFWQSVAWHGVNRILQLALERHRTGERNASSLRYREFDGANHAQ